MVVGGELVHLCPCCIGLNLGFSVAFVAASMLFRRGLVLPRTGPRLVLLLAVISLAFDWGVGGRLPLRLCRDDTPVGQDPQTGAVLTGGAYDGLFYLEDMRTTWGT